MSDSPASSLKLRLKKLIFEELNINHVSPEEFQDDAPLFGDELGLDSIDAIEITYLVERYFNVAMKDTKTARPALRSIDTLTAFIEKSIV